MNNYNSSLSVAPMCWVDCWVDSYPKWCLELWQCYCQNTKIYLLPSAGKLIHGSFITSTRRLVHIISKVCSLLSKVGWIDWNTQRRKIGHVLECYIYIVRINPISHLAHTCHLWLTMVCMYQWEETLWLLRQSEKGYVYSQYHQVLLHILEPANMDTLYKPDTYSRSLCTTRKHN